MNNRGPILIFFAICLVGSPAAVSWYQAEPSAVAAPNAIETVGSAQAECDTGSITTAIGRLGCNTNTARTEVRRLSTSGALFVKVHN